MEVQVIGNGAEVVNRLNYGSMVILIGAYFDGGFERIISENTGWIQVTRVLIP